MTRAAQLLALSFVLAIAPTRASAPRASQEGDSVGDGIRQTARVTDGRDEAHRAHGLDPRTPLEARAGQTAPSVLAMFREAGMGTPVPHPLSPPERQTLARALAALTPLHQRVLADRLRTISALDGMPNNALTSPVNPTETFRLFDITLRAGLFVEDASQFLTQKERTLFEAGPSPVEVSVEGGSMPSLVFVLLHEATHIVDVSEAITPGNAPPGAPRAFTRGTWTDRLVVDPRYHEPLLVQTVFRQGGAALPLAQAPALYAALQRTPFASIYGSSSAPDDLAEFVAWYHLTQKLDQPYRITVREGGRVVVSYDPMAAPLVRARFGEMAAFYDTRP